LPSWKAVTEIEIEIIGFIKKFLRFVSGFEKAKA
jgi:hypothetical protein